MRPSDSPRRRRGIIAVAVCGTLAAAAGWYAHAWIDRTIAATAGAARADAAAAAPPTHAITALGRLRPKDGVIRVAGPSQSTAVIKELRVDKGDHVGIGDAIAVLDSYPLLSAATERLQVEVEEARSEYERADKLFREHLVSTAERDERRAKLDALQADLMRGNIELDQAIVRAPISGQIIEIHARAGERVGGDGIVEVGKTDQMYAVAEVYETDIGRVAVGQHALVQSPALHQPLHGTVERLGMQIGRLDLVDADPVARTDARVVQVEIRLDDSQQVAALTNLQVEVAIEP